MEDGIFKLAHPRTRLHLIALVLLLIFLYLIHGELIHLLGSIVDACKPMFSAIADAIRHHGVLGILLFALVVVVMFGWRVVELHYQHLNKKIK